MSVIFVVPSASFPVLTWLAARPVTGDTGETIGLKLAAIVEARNADASVENEKELLDLLQKEQAAPLLQGAMPRARSS